MIAVPPYNGNDDAVPEGPDAALASGVDALGVLPAEDFVAQRRAQNANHRVNGGGDQGDLHATGPGEVGKVGVEVRADRIACDFFGGIVRGMGSCWSGGVGWSHGFWRACWGGDVTYSIGESFLAGLRESH